MKKPVIYATFSEVEIVNGNVINDIELEKKIENNKVVTKGYINGQPIKITRKNKNKNKRKNKRTTKHKRKKY
jgi:hypothetical protein